MPLNLQIVSWTSDVDSVRLGELALAWYEIDQAVGQPTRLRARVRQDEIDGERLKEVQARLAEHLALGRLILVQAHHDGLDVSPVARLEDVDEGDGFRFHALVTDAQCKQTPDAHAPRWRVLQAETADAFLDCLGHVAVPDDAVLAAVAGKKLMDPVPKKKPVELDAPALDTLRNIGDASPSAAVEVVTGLIGDLASGPAGLLEAGKGLLGGAKLKIGLPGGQSLGIKLDKLVEPPKSLDDLKGLFSVGPGGGPEKHPAQIVQSGVSDLALLQDFLALVYHQRDLPKLVVSGGPGGRRRISFGRPGDYGDALPTFPAEASVSQRVSLAGQDDRGVPGSRYLGRRPIGVLRWTRAYSPEPYRAACAVPMPARLNASDKNRAIYRCIHRLAERGAADPVLDWDSWFYPIPATDYAPGLPWDVRPEPNLVLGQVTSGSVNGGSVKVQLRGFEEGSDTVVAPLATPYSGPDEEKGIHLVPEGGTRVAVVVSGRIDELPVCVGNVRWHKVPRPAPSVDIRRKIDGYLGDVRLENVGRVSVESDLDLDLHKNLRAKVGKDAQISVEGNAGVEVKKDTNALVAGKLDVDVRKDVDVRVDAKAVVSTGADARVASNAALELVGGGLTAALRGGTMDVG
jgi:hypothetical protein